MTPDPPAKEAAPSTNPLLEDDFDFDPKRIEAIRAARLARQKKGAAPAQPAANADEAAQDAEALRRFRENH